MLSLALAFEFLSLFSRPRFALLYVISVVPSLPLHKNCLPMNAEYILRNLAFVERLPPPIVFVA